MKTIKFLASLLLVSAMTVLVACQPQNQPTPDNTDETSSTSKASIVGVWQGDMVSSYEYGEYLGESNISDTYWEFDNKGRWTWTTGGEDEIYQYKLIKNNTKLQMIEGYEVIDELNIKSLTSKKLEVEWVYLDEEGEEVEKSVFTFKRVE